MGAYYSNTLKGFLADSVSSVLGKLADGNSAQGFETNQETIESWKAEIAQLREVSEKLFARIPVSENWGVMLEYVIPMIGQRVDCVLLAGDMVIVLEFKAGESTSGMQALKQAQQYALNLSDFHEESRGRVIVPIALGDFRQTLGLDEDNSGRGAVVNAGKLADTLELAAKRWGGHKETINLRLWNESRYFPVPSIIEAASHIYGNHDVIEISMSKAGADNLKATEDFLVSSVRDAKRRGAKKLIILTGVPGAGKTLAGLNAVQKIQRELDANTEQASFLSGNRPLVMVLQEALKRSVRRSGKSGARSIQSRIRNMHEFVKESYGSTLPPSDKLVVFDEAQRAWTSAHNLKKFKRAASEPEMALDIMSRHADWAIILALVGGGQEIHGGEAGLAAWGDAVESRPEWEVVTSPEAITGGASVAGSRLFRNGIPGNVRVTRADSLHLSVSKRSFESLVTAEWVNSVLKGDTEGAKKLSEKGLSIRITRDLAKARHSLRKHSDARRRVGLIASSGADRLRADGVETPTFTFLQGIKFERWFLDDQDDYRSSNQLEVALSEFEMQGLEIDVCCLLWGGDLIIADGKPLPRKLKQTEWVKCKSSGDPQAGADDTAVRTLNKYRVLMTRFRKEMVIYVPLGDHGDRTRAPSDFDSVYYYLKDCGLAELV